jgi:hypothetical protein
VGEGTSGGAFGENRERHAMSWGEGKLSWMFFFFLPKHVFLANLFLSPTSLLLFVQSRREGEGSGDDARAHTSAGRVGRTRGSSAVIARVASG